VEKYCRAKQATDDNIRWRMRIVFRIPKAINPHSQYAILIAFPLQQWLQERASLLRHNYIPCLTHHCVVTDIQLPFIFLYKELCLPFWAETCSVL